MSPAVSSDRAVRQRVLGAGAVIGLARRSRTDVPTLVVVVAEMGHGIGPGRHRLRLERFELGELVGAHLDRHHPAEIAPPWGVR